MPEHSQARTDRRDVDRGRTIVTRYVQQTDDVADRPDERATAAGDLIGDVLAYVVTLPDRDVPPPYRGGPITRIAATAARGVRNALYAESPDNGFGDPGSDPGSDDLHEASLTFTECVYRA
jgi:hypothetical protein